MCGIAGIYYYSQQKTIVEATVIKTMTDVIEHRGPDGDGCWIHSDGFLGFGHRRLSIIDLSDAAKQPFHAFGYTITYNGEIYNYIELKKELIKEGYNFYSESDTEVILASYHNWGKECLKYFDGMWSFAIWDEKNQELFCAVDRFGEKPFHYYCNNGKFVFGSEMKSLFAIGVPKQINDYMMYLFINMELHENPNNVKETFFKNVFRLEPASYMVINSKSKSDSIKQVKYWELNIENKHNDSFEEASEKLKQLFFDSVLIRLRSEVPIGTSLSGGLDSSAVVGAIHHLTNGKAHQKCFSARFNNPLFDEGYFMNLMIKKTDFKHFVTIPDHDTVINNIHKILYHQEEPFGSASVNVQWEIYKLAKQNDVTVLLDGQGADETLCGYTHFFLPYLRAIYLNEGNKEMQRQYRLYCENNFVSELLKVNLMFKLEAKFPSMFELLRKNKRIVFGAKKINDIHNDLYYLYNKEQCVFKQFFSLKPSMKHYTLISGLTKLLRFADRNSMAHSREVRLPFLSTKIVEYVFALPDSYFIRDGWTKALLRNGLKDLLPSEIVWRKNKFGMQPPENEWMQNIKLHKALVDYHLKAINEKMISPKADVSWKSIMTGMFLFNNGG